MTPGRKFGRSAVSPEIGSLMAVGGRGLKIASDRRHVTNDGAKIFAWEFSRILSGPALVESTAMDKEKLAAALRGVGNLPDTNADILVGSANAPIERRIAAIMYAVVCSDLPIRNATLRLVLDLTQVAGGPTDGTDPADTWLGIAISRLLQGWPDQLANEGEAFAAKLIVLAEQTATVPTESDDLRCYMASGKEAMWWIGWIREQRQKME